MDGRIPIHPEPEQRYWRSRGNRTVRTKRRTRNLVRLVRVGLIHGLVVAFLVFGAVRAFRQLGTADVLNLERIELRGIARASEPRLRGELGRFVGHNLIELDLEQVSAAAVQDVWVRDAVVRRVLPETLLIDVAERVPVALAAIDGSLHVIDTTGGSVGLLGPEMQEDLPILRGLDRLDDETRQRRLVRGVAGLAELTRESPAFAAGISELDLSAADCWVVTMVRPGPLLLLDPESVGRNVNHWLTYQERIEASVGDAVYIDLRWNGRISVMPAGAGRA